MDNKNDYGITTPRFARRVVCAAIRCDDGFIKMTKENHGVFSSGDEFRQA